MGKRVLPVATLALVLVSLLGLVTAGAQEATGTVTIMWSANTEADVQGYRVYVGTSSGSRAQMFDVGNITSTRLTLPLGSTYFFVVTAYDTTGNESSPSAELSRSIF